MALKITEGVKIPCVANLAAFSRALTREVYVLTQYPDLLWQQLYNRLQWEGEDVKQVLAPDLAERSMSGARPWIHLFTRLRESDALIRTISGHAQPVSGCVVSPDGTWFVSSGHDGTVRIWDSSTGAERATFNWSKSLDKLRSEP